MKAKKLMAILICFIWVVASAGPAQAIDFSKWQIDKIIGTITYQGVNGDIYEDNIHSNEYPTMKDAVEGYYKQNQIAKYLLKINGVPIEQTEFASYAGKECLGPAKVEAIQRENEAAQNTPNGVRVKVNGELVIFPDARPYVEEATNRTVIPVRFVMEKLGCTVDWVNSEQKVIAKKSGTEIILLINNNVATVNSANITIDQPPILKEDRTFVPLRFFAETLGAKVDWVEAESTVLITTN